MRMASAAASVVTPRAAARAGSGRNWTSGRCSAALDVTLPMPMPCRVRNCDSSDAAALSSAVASLPASVICSFSPLPPLLTATRTPGRSRNW